MTLVSHTESKSHAPGTSQVRSTRLRHVSPWRPTVLLWLLALVILPMLTAVMMLTLVMWLIVR